MDNVIIIKKQKEYIYSLLDEKYKLNIYVDFDYESNQIELKICSHFKDKYEYDTEYLEKDEIYVGEIPESNILEVIDFLKTLPSDAFIWNSSGEFGGCGIYRRISKSEADVLNKEQELKVLEHEKELKELEEYIEAFKKENIDKLTYKTGF